MIKIKRSKITFLRTQLSEKTEKENCYDHFSYYLDENSLNPVKNDNILKKSFTKSDFNYLIKHNDSFNTYSKKTTLLKFDPHFLNKKQNYSIENLYDSLENSNAFHLQENCLKLKVKKPIETSQNSNKKKISRENYKEMSFSNDSFEHNRVYSNNNTPNNHLQKTNLEENSDDGSQSELSFEKICEKPSENITPFQLSSEKRIKEKFSANDSFYKNMINDLNSNKKSGILDEINSSDVFDKELEKKDQINNNNHLIKLQEVANEKSGSFLRTNSSFLENPQQRVSSKKINQAKNKVTKKFENFEILNELNKKLKEKEKEIEAGFKIHTQKQNDLFLPFKMSPKRNTKNELLIKNATEKVQKMFNSFKDFKLLRLY